MGLLSDLFRNSCLLKDNFGTVIVAPKCPDERQHNVGRRSVDVGVSVDKFAKWRQNIFVEQNFDAPVRVERNVPNNRQWRKRNLLKESEIYQIDQSAVQAVSKKFIKPSKLRHTQT